MILSISQEGVERYRFITRSIPLYFRGRFDMGRIHSVSLQKVWKGIVSVLMIISYSSIIRFSSAPGLEKLAFINKCGNICAYSVPVFVLLYIANLAKTKKYRPSNICWWIISLYCLLFFSAILHGNDFIKKGIVGNITMTLFFDGVLQSEDKDFFHAFLGWLNVLTVINLLSVIMFCKSDGFTYYNSLGLYEPYTYILAGDNGHIVTVFPAMCFDVALYAKTRKKRFLFLALILSTTFFLTFSVTSIIMICLTVGLYVLYTRVPLLRRIGTNRWVPVLGLILFFILFIELGGYQLFSTWFSTLFGKDIVSSGRAWLYPIANEYIFGSPWIGYGYVSSFSRFGGLSSPHNVVQNMLLSGGIIGLVIYFTIIVCTMRNTADHRKGNKGYLFFICAFEAYLFASMAEAYENYLPFFLFWWICLSISQWDSFEKIL